MEFCLDYQITILEMDWNKDYIASEELIEHSNYDLDPSIGLYIGTKTSSLWGVLLAYHGFGAYHGPSHGDIMWPIGKKE